MVNNLTARQQEILDFIVGHIRKRAIAPTAKEIAEHFGFNLNAAQCHLKVLETKGKITKVPGIARGIRVIEERPLARYSDKDLLNELRERKVL